MEEAKSAQVIAIKHALKANETADNLQKELSVEKESSVALQQ